MGSRKITIKSPGNIQRPVEGSKSELIVLSVFLHSFLTSTWLLGCRDREGRMREVDFVQPRATIRQEQEFRVYAKRG